MDRLTQRDLRHLLEFVRGLYREHDLDGLGTYVLRQLPRLVASDITVYNELDPRRRRATWREEPSVAAFFPDARRVFERHMGDHPPIARSRRDAHAMKISDFLTQRQFRRLGLYQEFFRRFDGKYQMAVGLPAPPPLVVGILLNRSALDFTERDRLLMDLLRPHLAQAYENAGVVTEFRQILALARRGVDHLARGLIVVAGNGRVRLVTEQARRWVSRYLPANGRPWPGRRLPDALGRWLNRQASSLAFRGDRPSVPTPMVLERPDGRLVIRPLLEADHRLLLLEEEVTAVWAGPLQACSLTPREAEVLAWVAEGKTNVEIAVILGASRRTVSKHLERIFQKLGVETRTAAARRAFELQHGPLARA
jgi:DNA-binding CsgD family transcriptional regulator